MKDSTEDGFRRMVVPKIGIGRESSLCIQVTENHIQLQRKGQARYCFIVGWLLELASRQLISDHLPSVSSSRSLDLRQIFAKGKRPNVLGAGDDA